MTWGDRFAIKACGVRAGTRRQRTRHGESSTAESAALSALRLPLDVPTSQDDVGKHCISKFPARGCRGPHRESGHSARGVAPFVMPAAAAEAYHVRECMRARA